MTNLIKSHSNYVLKKKHQNVSDGTIWERDITTIGGVNFFAPGQTPIYRDNNFIITIRNDGNVTNQYNHSKWIDSSSGNVWTLESVNSITSDLDEQNDTKIVIKQDYYDFCDFAYYGSLTELFRSSITDIINRFPGELYGSEDKVYYDTTETIDGESYITSRELGKEVPEKIVLPSGKKKITGYTTGDTTYYELKNPFGINIHSSKKPVGANSLKYFADGGYGNYTINDDAISTWTPSDINECASPGELICTVTINNETVYVYAGTGGSIHYMHTNMEGVHIKPNEPYLNQFYNECDSFQRLLMNQETTPKYKAEFSVIHENEYGYYRRMESFIFPTSDGGYNIDPTAYGFNDYTARLSKIGEFYDDRFTDNMWRSMTHEAIKNFDWTYTREYTEGDAEEYVLGGEKIQKALRVFAREFDEVKSYIDNINTVNRVTYDDRNNLPNYFLTDTCENEGWDIVQVIPYFTTSATTKEGIVVDVFTQDNKKTIHPYSGVDDSYIVKCSGKKVCSYIDTGKTYTYMDVNNEFLRRLKLNSRYIWRHKGTIEGIEMILAMFGMKSKRYNDGLSGYTDNWDEDNFDYEITEYTRSTNGINDPLDTCHSTHLYDWINSTKTINYDYRTISSYNQTGNLGVTYIPYQGLPVKYIDKTDGKRYLYPNFEKYEQYDGNPYFQMNGGWLSKTVSGKSVSGTVVEYGFQYDNEGKPLFVQSGDTLYKETMRSIRSVKNLNEMLSIPSSQLKDGLICYVESIDNDVLAVDGEVFDIHTDTSSNKFIILTRSGGVIKVGNKYFDDIITVYNKNGDEYTYTIDDKLDGYEVYAYIIGNNFMCKNGSYQVTYIPPIKKSEPGELIYYKLGSVEHSTEIDNGGWERLDNTSCDFKRIKTIWNYYKGNNPHNGNLSYDKGEEYYEYFRHLFKYASENNLFDDRCYDNYESAKSTISGVGFSEMSALTTDTKVHYFGDYYQGKEKFHEYTISSSSKRKYDDYSYSFIEEDSEVLKNEEKNPYISRLKSDKITNQIMNDKRIKLSFNVRNNYSGNTNSDYKGKSELKFIDEIVMNYLTQLVPSTAIFEVEYKFKEGGLPNDYCK